jgi:surfeit locus 1 family protein
LAADATRSPAQLLLVPGITTLVMLAVLIGLGTWQLQRRTWKTGLLADIATAESAPAVKLTAMPAPFSKISASGTLRRDLQARYGIELRGETLGAHLIVPLERPPAPPLLVDLGWVPLKPQAPLVLPSGDIEGFARPAESAGPFAARDNLTERLFYTLDPTVIGPALGLASVAPFVLTAIGPAQDGIYPQPVQTLPRPPNNHLQYAFTWFGFAATLVVIFALYARKALRP